MNGSAEQASETIATVAISLPSEYTGGETHFNLRDLQKIFRTEDASEFETTYFAWYADVYHVAKQLVSGYRLSLLYHIKLAGSTIISCRPSTVLSDPEKDLSKAMAEWQTATITSLASQNV